MKPPLTVLHSAQSGIFYPASGGHDVIWPALDPKRNASTPVSDRQLAVIPLKLASDQGMSRVVKTFLREGTNVAMETCAGAKVALQMSALNGGSLAVSMAGFW